MISLKKIETLIKEDIQKSETLEVFDITIQDNHNYIVYVDEDTSVLSHNCLEFVVKEIIGPVVVTSKTTSLIPEIEIVKTNITYKLSKLWVHSISAMLKNKEKNALLIEHIMKDLEEHPCIIIPTDRIEHVNLLRNMINDEAIKRGLCQRSKNIAYTFYGTMSPKEKRDVLDKVDTGECRVLVSMRSMIKQGIDLKKPTILYHIIPETATRDAGSPMFLQLSNRPCTPHLNKKQPKVKMFVDDTDLSKACFTSLYTHEIRPNLVPSERNSFGVRYKITDENKKIAYEIINAKSKKQFRPGFNI